MLVHRLVGDRLCLKGGISDVWRILETIRKENIPFAELYKHMYKYTVHWSIIPSRTFSVYLSKSNFFSLSLALTFSPPPSLCLFLSFAIFFCSDSLCPSLFLDLSIPDESRLADDKMKMRSDFALPRNTRANVFRFHFPMLPSWPFYEL